MQVSSFFKVSLLFFTISLSAPNQTMLTPNSPQEPCFVLFEQALGISLR